MVRVPPVGTLILLEITASILPTRTINVLPYRAPLSCRFLILGEPQNKTAAPFA
jgi:hypothetical protein